MKFITAADTIDALQEIFSRQGLPKQLVTDNGRQFISSEFKEFMDSGGITHLFTPPYHRKSNGQAENFVKALKTALRRSSEERGRQPSETS